MAFGPKQLLAIDWDRKSLRMVLVRPRSRGVDLIKAVSVPIPPEVRIDDAGALGAFMRDAMSRSKIGVRRSVLCIGRDQVVLNTLNLPPTTPEEMPAIVQFQIIKELPFSPDEAVLDFAVSGVFDAKLPSTVLVAAVRKDVLEFQRQVAAAAGLSVQSIGLRPHSNLSAILTDSPDLADTDVLMVDVGPQMSEINIIRRGALGFSRAASASLPPGGSVADAPLLDSRIVAAPLEDREEDETHRQAVASLMVDIIRSFEAYRATEPGVSLDRIVVCGATGIEPQLAEALAARFAARAELYTPERSLGLPPPRARELRGFSAAIGLALNHDAAPMASFDFLSPKKPVSRRTIRLKKVPVIAATILLFLASGIVFHVKFIRPRQLEVEELQLQADAKKEEEKKIVAFKDQVESLEEWMASEHVWPEVLVALSNGFPERKEAYAEGLDFEMRPAGKKTARRESFARLRFLTKTLGTVNRVSTKLREEGFDDIVPGKETFSPSPDGYTNDTGINLRIPSREEWRAARGAQEPRLEGELELAPLEAVDPVQPSPKGKPAAEGAPVAAGDPAAGADSAAGMEGGKP